MKNNTYLPFRSEILEVIKHADLEYTFRMAYDRGAEHPVKPGQFFEISIPKYGEAPISVSGITDHSLDFTIRKVGSLTNEIFENYVGGHFFLRGPYGNGFDVDMFKGKEIILVAGGSGLSPIHGVIDYFADHMDECERLTVIVGFKSPHDILFRDDLKRWKASGMNLIYTVDKADDDPDYDGHVGLVTQYIPEMNLQDPDNAIAVVVGPEGGLSRSEADALLACNPRASLVSLGSSILRTETAGIVAPALVLHELGRMMHDAREAQERTSAHVESRREEAGDACEAGGQS